jgi:hypothetical protein
MNLPRHPKLMSDQELCDLIESWIRLKVPESNELDYKESISVASRKEKFELGKDISSFANERGGVLLYGVPEIKEDGVPVPDDLSKCGIDLLGNLSEDIERILFSIIVPPLTELDIRVLKIQELSPKSLLFIYHPESWNKPHMLEGYKDHRYYRRENFQSVPMNERAIEAAYLFRKISLSHANNFFETGFFKEIPANHGHFIRAIICPRYSLNRKETMFEEQFKSWLVSNSPGGRDGEWIPFVDGWTFESYAQGEFHGHLFEVRLFHNGGICFTYDLKAMFDVSRGLYLNPLAAELKNTFLPLANKACEYLGISGPLSLQISFHNNQKVNAWVNISGNLHYGMTKIDKKVIHFVEEMSVSELSLNSVKVFQRLMRRLYSTFGIWIEGD